MNYNIITLKTFVKLPSVLNNTQESINIIKQIDSSL